MPRCVQFIRVFTEKMYIKFPLYVAVQCTVQFHTGEKWVILKAVLDRLIFKIFYVSVFEIYFARWQEINIDCSYITTMAILYNAFKKLFYRWVYI